LVTTYFSDYRVSDACAYGTQLALVRMNSAKLKPLLRYECGEAVGSDKEYFIVNDTRLRKTAAEPDAGKNEHNVRLPITWRLSS
jgi:hypothetical protein